MEPDLSKLGRAYRDEIRDKVLPRTSATEFNRLALAPPRPRTDTESRSQVSWHVLWIAHRAA
jgi:hypothetical protein